MKKIIGFVSLCFFAAACQQAVKRPFGNTFVYEQPSMTDYTNWDRAVRIDTDMQNMYINAPHEIKKPIDMYMAMALALKYNYSRRLYSYEQMLVGAGQMGRQGLNMNLEKAGYVNTTNSEELSPELKVAWNVLDVSSIYYQSNDSAFKNNLAFEQSRKVIHNILQETRLLYWKSLTAQRLLPVVDNMTEYLTAEVDKMNAAAKTTAAQNKTTSRDDLIKKRKYMQAIKDLANIKRKFENAPSQLAGLMGLHPTTSFKVVGKQYGQFELPEINENLAQLEWLALSNRPELRVQDLVSSNADKELIIRNFSPETESTYQTNPETCNKRWSQQGIDYGFALMEEARAASVHNLETLRRQRLTSLILNQVYVAWAQYMSAVEDYRINMEIADASEGIAEDYTATIGSKNEQSQLEAARAIEDEVKAFLSYADVQEALGNLYATIGLDALPYYMLEEKPSAIALYLNKTMAKWADGQFYPADRPYLMDIQSLTPPLDLSEEVKMSDVSLKVGEPLSVAVPKEVFENKHFKGDVQTKAGKIDDSPLPAWINYNEKERYFSGTPTEKDVGTNGIKVYGVDEKGNVCYATFDITVSNSLIPVLTVRGLTEERTATVMQPCKGLNCKAPNLEQKKIGRKVTKAPIKK